MKITVHVVKDTINDTYLNKNNKFSTDINDANIFYSDIVAEMFLNVIKKNRYQIVDINDINLTEIKEK